jgi:hypothetical protein
MHQKIVDKWGPEVKQTTGRGKRRAKERNGQTKDTAEINQMQNRTVTKSV